MVRISFLLPLLPQVYVTLLALGARSRDPIFLGRYSRSLLLFDLALIAASALLAVAARRRAFVTASLAVAALLVLSYPLGANNQVLAAPFAVSAIVLARVGLSATLLLLAFRARERGRLARGLAVAGSTLLALTAADGAALALIPRAAPVSHGGFEFRQPVEPGRIPGDAIVIVGDSVVYGSGVAEGDAFPAVLGRRPGPPVYSLGQRGTGLPEYLSVLRALPAVDTAIVCFTMNDMPSRETRALKLAQTLAGARRTSLFCRLASDALSVRELPDVDTYERWVAGDYDRTEPTFGRRWERLESDLTAVAAEARRVSRRRPPLFVIVPMMQRYAEYPLAGAHRDLGALAASLGFDVLDLLPVFAREFPDGGRFRAAPDDGHFDARVHAEVARQLAARLAGG